MTAVGRHSPQTHFSIAGPFPVLHVAIPLISRALFVCSLSDRRAVGAPIGPPSKGRRADSVGTKANMEALKTGNVSHNASLRGADSLVWG